MTNQKMNMLLMLWMIALSSFAMEDEQSTYRVDIDNVTKMIRSICLFSIKDQKTIESLRKQDQQRQSWQSESDQHFISSIENPLHRLFIGYIKQQVLLLTIHRFSEEDLRKKIQEKYSIALDFATTTYSKTEDSAMKAERKKLEKSFPLDVIIAIAKEATLVHGKK